MVELPAGEQYVQVDFGSQYYINEINITHANDSREVYGVKVQIWDGAQNTDWETVYEETKLQRPTLLSSRNPYQKRWVSSNL